MYATVKELHDDTVLLEVAPGVHAVYAKNSIGAVLDDEEYNRIVHGDGHLKVDGPVVPDDASSLTEAADTDSSDDAKIDLGKKPESPAADDAEPKADVEPQDVAESKDAEPKDDVEPKDGKADGETDAK